MRKFTLREVMLLSVFLMLTLYSCRKDDPGTLTPPPIPDQSFVEEFDTTSASFQRGWVPKNVSESKGQSVWVQGLFNNPTITGFPSAIPFAAYSSKGSYAGFIGTDFLSTTAGAATISNWLISPSLILQNGDKIIFYTRTLLLPFQGTDSTDFANRLQVRINTLNDGLNVGSGIDPGDFKETILDINPAYKEYHTDPAQFDPTAYPARWTRFEALINSLNGPTKGRFAFRYFTELAGNNGRATAVAIDSVAYVGKHN